MRSRSNTKPQGKFHVPPFYATGECPWDRMGSVCWRSHDHVVSDKDRAIMRKVNDRREQIRADRKKDDGGDGNKDKKTKGKGRGKSKDPKKEAGGGRNQPKAKAQPGK